MAESMRPAQGNNEEIDLLVVLERTTSFLSRYKTVMIVFAVAGALIGGLYHFVLKTKYYDSTLILHSQVLTNAEEVAIVGNWNELLRNHEFAVLTKILNCPQTLLEDVGGLNASFIQVSSLLSGFSIEASVRNTAILPDLQKAIIFGLGNSEFVKEKVAVKKENIVTMISTVKQEMNKLDSFQRMANYSSLAKTGGNVVVMGISDTIGRIITLQQKLNDSKESLQFAEAIEVLQDFPKTERPSGPRGSITIGVAGAVGLFLGFLVALFRDLKAPIRQIRIQREAQLLQKGLV